MKLILKEQTTHLMYTELLTNFNSFKINYKNLDGTEKFLACSRFLICFTSHILGNNTHLPDFH